MLFAAVYKKAPLLGAFFIAVFFCSTLAAQCRTEQSLEWVAVASVHDGDTLRLKDKRRVRVVGINAPELSFGARKKPEPYAIAARDRLRQLVAANDGRVGLKVEGRDRYGRTLARLYGQQGRSLEAQLLAEGLGYFVEFGPATPEGRCLARAEQKAQRRRVGVWRSNPIVTPQELQQAGFSLLQSRVLAVEQNRAGLWLELAGGAVVRIAPDALKAFTKQALGELGLKRWQDVVGRKIFVRGWVVGRGTKMRSQARWMLLLTSPSMLEVAR